MPTSLTDTETHSVTFSNASSSVVTFTGTYGTAPKVTATASDDVNVFISAISTTSATVSTSQNFTGTVYVHVMGF
jgi:hypothetical protein